MSFMASRGSHNLQGYELLVINPIKKQLERLNDDELRKIAHPPELSLMKNLWRELSDPNFELRASMANKLLAERSSINLETERIERA